MREVRVDVHRVLNERACGVLRDILIPIMLQPMGSRCMQACAKYTHVEVM
jgi:hypothetical protein